MNNKQRRTLSAVLTDPVQLNIKWIDIESLLRAIGAEIKEGKGFKVRVILNERRGVFHQPHPGITAKRYQVEDIRDLLKSAGVNNDL